MSRAPRRGEIYWVALDPAVGTEIKKTRPAVVVSNDSCNTHGSRIVVLPVTSNVDSLYPGEALIRIKGQPGRALGDQTITPLFYSNAERSRVQRRGKTFPEGTSPHRIGVVAARVGGRRAELWSDPVS